MAFEKAFHNSYNELPIPTQYRFAEIEIKRALSALVTLYKPRYTPRMSALSTIYDYLTPDNLKTDEYETEFTEAFNSPYFNQPNKHEVIHYLIARGHSYTKIRNLTSAAFNTISKMKYDHPIYYPVFKHWTPDMLNRWNELKKHFNLFDEDLAHMKEI
jgi:hypothetical protein